MDCSQNLDQSKVFYIFEWKNPRFGKIIKHISLYGIKSFRNTSDKLIPENAIILRGINYAKKRPIPDVAIKSSEINK
jgi:hypothetical protein